MEIKSEILIEQMKIITELAELNKYLLELLSQHIDTTEENERLNEILKGESMKSKAYEENVLKK